MPTVVVGVASPSSPCARPLLCTRGRRSNDHHRRSKNQWGSVSTIYERGRRSPTIVVIVVYPSSPGARPLLCTRGRRSNDHHRRSQMSERNQWGRVSTIYERRKNPECCRGVSFSFVPMCQTIWCNALGNERRSDHHQRSNVYTTWAESFQEKTRQTDSQPVMNNNNLI